MVVHNHHDLTWRRCFDRDLEYKGESFVPYSHLQALYILKNLDNCKKHDDYKFTIECVAVLKKFLQSFPEKEETVREYLASGRIHIPLTGHNIVDSNLILGESIVRNYLFGHDYLKSKFSYKADGFDRNDSFGNSAQLPQIARGFGTNWVYNVVYTYLKGNYWQGLDKSILANVDPQISAVSGGYAKYRPCPVCHGKDKECSACGGDRIDKVYIEDRRSRISVSPDPQTENLQGMVYVSAEELLPSDEIFSWKEENSDKYNVYFSNIKEIAYKHFGERISRADDPPENEMHPSPEVNFNNTGVYASRIRTKQDLRALENRIYSAEGASVMAALSGREYPFDSFCDIWDKLLFSMFHDAVTGTMVDQAYDELMDVHKDIDKMLDGIESAVYEGWKSGELVCVVNPTGNKLSGAFSVECEKGKALFSSDGRRLPIIKWEERGDKNLLTVAVFGIDAFSSETYNVRECQEAFEREFHKFGFGEAAKIAAVLRNDVEQGKDNEKRSTAFSFENEYYLINADHHGICEIIDKKTKRVVFKESEYKIGEWILEHDEGSPWATLSEDMRRMPMSGATMLMSYEETEDVTRLTYHVSKRFWGYAVDSGHDIRYTVTLVRGIKKIFFEADVFWDTQNHRLRVAFPTPVKGAHVYEIPFGYLEREPYEPNCVWSHGPSNWAGANGDCPAINWAGVEGKEASVALLNKGTPCMRIEDDKNGNKSILLTVLRSPSVGTYLHEPLSYSMTDYDRMRDPGHHHFEFALTSYDSPFSENHAVADGCDYNSVLYAGYGEPEKVQMPGLSSEDIRCSAVKWAQDRSGFIMRMWECHGRKDETLISVPDYVKAVYETDLKEDTLRELEIENESVSLSFDPFKIKTLKFVLK